MGAVQYRVRCLLGGDWRASAGLALAVAVVGGIVLTLVAGAHRTQTTPDRYSEARGDRWDTQMEQNDGVPLTEAVEALPSVAEVTSATFLFAGFLDDEGLPYDESVSFVGEPEAFGAELTEGRLADPADPHEFTASPDFVALTGVEIGDTIPFVSISAATAAEFGFGAETLDGPAFDATLVGIVVSPAAALQDRYALTVFPLTLLGEGSIGVSATESLVALEAGATVADLRDDLDTLEATGADGSTLEGADLTLDPAEWVGDEVTGAVQAQAAALWVIAGIVALAGLVVVGQIAVRRARLSNDQRLSLSALGFTRSQVLADASTRTAIPAGMGALGAMALAVAASATFPFGFVEPLEPDPGTRFDPLFHLGGAGVMLIGLVATTAVALALGELGERRRRPVSTMESLAARIGRLQPALGLRFAFARHPRDAGRLSTPAIGLFALLVVFVGAATFGQSLDSLLDHRDRQGQTFDAAIGQGGGEIPPDAIDVLLADPGVGSLSLFGSIRVSVDEAGLDITGFREVVGDLGVRVLDGEVPTAPDQIALGRRSAEAFGVGVGDQITVAARADTRALTVVATVVMPGVEGAEGLGKGGLVTEETFRSLDEEAALTFAALDFAPGADREAVTRRLSEALMIEVGEEDPPSVIVNLDRVRSAPYIVAGILLLLAVLSLANLIGVALHHRRVEIAVLRSAGADRRLVRAVVHWHTIVFTLAVSLLATPFGVALGRLIFGQAIAERIGVGEDTAVPAMELVVVLAVLVLVAELVGQTAVRRRHHVVARELAAE